MKKLILGLNELEILVDEVLNSLGDGVVILQGDLASGKTSFVKAFVKKLDISDNVTSPTFSLQQCYSNNIYHYDIYNHGLNHFISLGMLEELDKAGIHFVEWGDDELKKILDLAGIENIKLKIKKISDDKREYTICTH